MRDCYEPGDKDGNTMKICKFYLEGGCCNKPSEFICKVLLDKIKPGWDEKKDNGKRA